MNLTVQEIGRLVQGEVRGDARRRILGVAGLEEASPEDISFLKDARQIQTLRSSRAGAVLISRSQAPKADPQNGQVLILVDHPILALAILLQLVEAEKSNHPQGIHSTAIIHPTALLEPGVAIGPYTIIEPEARIGKGTRIYAQCYIGKGSRLGPGCLIYPQVVIRDNVALGKGCTVHSGSVLGADGYGYIPVQGRHQKIPQVGGVIIEDHVEIGAGVTVDKATMGNTRIGTGTKIDNLVQIAHNVQIGPHCLIVAQVGIAGSSRIGAGVTLAGQVGVSDHITVGDGTVVGPQGGVTSNVPAHETYWGSPAQPHMQYKRQLALLKKLPELLGKKKDK